MAITLGGVDLPDLVKDNEFAQFRVDSIVEQTLGGRPIAWEQERQFTTFDLIGGADFGWIDRDTLNTLAGMASTPSQSYSLVYEGVTSVVRFRNEEPPPISASPVVSRPNQVDADYYNNVRIKLMEV